VKSRRVLAMNASSSPGRYCIRLSRVLTSAVSWAMLRLARFASDRFRCDHTSPAGLSSCAYGGSWQTVSQPRAAISSFMAALTWGVQVVPHDHQRAAELLVGGVQQLGVAGLGEALALVLAACAAAVDAVDEPGPLPRCDADQRGEGYARVVRACHLHHRSGAAPSPGAPLGRT
jgi:hypothetical protein